MIPEPKLFYQTYLKDYHKIKALYLKCLLDNLTRYEFDFFGPEVDDEEREEIKRTIKLDLRQTYFHAIETFFELFFALNPKDKNQFDDEFVLIKLTQSDWRDNFSQIEDISKNENALDFLNEKIQFYDHEVTIGQYLFYMGFFDTNKLTKEVFEDIFESIEAIKYGIKIIAKDFTHRDEYNSYKHGLRAIPAITKFMLADFDTMKIIHEYDVSGSISFYHKTNFSNEIKVRTVLFDVERDFQMILFCSNLIRNLVFYRRISYKFENDKTKFPKIQLYFFEKEEVQNCNKINVPIQDIVHTISRTNTNNTIE